MVKQRGINKTERDRYEGSLYSTIRNKEHQEELKKKYIELRPETNLNKNPWLTIQKIDINFFNELQDIKKIRTGRGIHLENGINYEFLPSNPKELVAELTRLIGSYKSGNTSTFNEINAIVDELRRSGNISLEESKDLYKILK